MFLFLSLALNHRGSLKLCYWPHFPFGTTIHDIYKTLSHQHKHNRESDPWSSRVREIMAIRDETGIGLPGTLPRGKPWIMSTLSLDQGMMMPAGHLRATVTSTKPALVVSRTEMIRLTTDLIWVLTSLRHQYASVIHALQDPSPTLSRIQIIFPLYPFAVAAEIRMKGATKSKTMMTIAMTKIKSVNSNTTTVISTMRMKLKIHETNNGDLVKMIKVYSGETPWQLGGSNILDNKGYALDCRFRHGAACGDNDERGE
jgi:hypothetical protein